ncbi:hypothetical protein MMC07_005819 [Pseudocyphellaria aurata]|nr:hypothetical protein [Pseudocyphellaria aurata]
MNNSNAGSKRLNILVLDGGGVRGLSSLLIVKALMVQVNLSLAERGTAVGELQPHHVFQLVAGTSTGGLIALMMGKMGMTVDECVTQYEKLSKEIFGRKHLRGRLTRGLAPAKFSGKRLRNCIRTLLRERHLDEDLLMKQEADSVPCLPCKDSFTCKVCDAARATSAAPTFFPVMNINDRFFADGGLAHNNPSFAIYFHYTGDQRKKSTKLRGAPQFSPHGPLDCSRVRFTNIGTGAKVDEVVSEKQGLLAWLIPGFIRKGVFLKQTLTDIATNSEEKAETMRQFQYLNPNTIMYERFDANHGVSSFKLDDYNALGEIKRRTELYLAEQETKDLLEHVGSALANDFLITRSIRETNAQQPDLGIDESRQSLEASSLVPASSSLRSDPSTHSNDPGGESLFPNHDNPPNSGPALLAKTPAENSLPLIELLHDDSGIDAMEPETLLVAAPA